jgi:hypothetical protein
MTFFLLPQMMMYAIILTTEGDVARRECTKKNISFYKEEKISVYLSYNQSRQEYIEENYNGVLQYPWISKHKESSGIARLESFYFIKNYTDFHDNDIFIISDDRRELVNESNKNTKDLIIANMRENDFCYTKSSDSRSIKGTLKNWGQIYITNKKNLSNFLNNLNEIELNAIRSPFMQDYAMLQILLKKNKRIKCIQEFKRVNRYKGKSIARFIPNNIYIKNWYTQVQWNFIKAAVSVMNIKKINKYQRKILFKIDLPDNSAIIIQRIKKTHWNKTKKTGFEKHFKIINYIMSLNKKNLINSTVKKRFPRYGRGLWTGTVANFENGMYIIRWEDGTETNMTGLAVRKNLI